MSEKDSWSLKNKKKLLEIDWEKRKWKFIKYHHPEYFKGDGFFESSNIDKLHTKILEDIKFQQISAKMPPFIPEEHRIDYYTLINALLQQQAQQHAKIINRRFGYTEKRK